METRKSVDNFIKAADLIVEGCNNHVRFTHHELLLLRSNILRMSSAIKLRESRDQLKDSQMLAEDREDPIDSQLPESS